MKQFTYLVLLLFLAACNFSEQAQQASALRYVQTIKEANCFTDSAFYKELSIGDYRFQVSATTQNASNELHILTSQNGVLLDDTHQLMNQLVVDTLLTDLNNNQIPELLVITEDVNTKQKKVYGFEHDTKNMKAFSLSVVSGKGQEAELYLVENNQLVHQTNIDKTVKREVYSLNLFHQLTLMSAS